jgi:ubiquinol-cytochrome c reductase iron-sulfur subunit
MSDKPDDISRRRTLVRLTAAAGGVAAAGAAVPFIASLAPSERARAAGAPVEADIESLKPAVLRTIEWRGQPVWILRRTPDMLQRLASAEPLLIDPGSRVGSQQPDYAKNPTRSIEPEVLVTVALCTHLGCIPSYYPAPDSLQPGWPGGFYCPCHGSKFDLAGRVYRGSPAPTNLVIPPHRYESATRLVVGEDAKS